MRWLPICLFVAAACGFAAQAETVDAHKTIQPRTIQWGPPPAMLPAGAQAALLYGDPAKEGPFALRLKAPAGYVIAPHTHRQLELVTVLSGAVALGRGPKAERAGAEALPTGGFFAMPAGIVHYVYVDEDAVVQINGMGPFDLVYADPKNDPRLNVAPTN